MEWNDLCAALGAQEEWAGLGEHTELPPEEGVQGPGPVQKESVSLQPCSTSSMAVSECAVLAPAQALTPGVTGGFPTFRAGTMSLISKDRTNEVFKPKHNHNGNICGNLALFNTHGIR